jgi:hypothetical protein
MNKINLQPVRLGYLCLSPAAILFAIFGTPAKFLFNSGISPYQLSASICALACAA